MDVISNAHCTLHPQAEHFLFKHKRAVLNVFRDVIGINELHHLSIACINNANKVLFLSHTPSIEYHLITSNLWQYDLSLNARFYQHEQAKSWDTLYHPEKYFELNDIKQARNKFSAGFSIPLKKNGMYVIYSFATKLQQITPELFFLERTNELIKLGDYCFNKLSTIFLLQGFHSQHENKALSSRHLSLVTNTFSTKTLETV